MVDVLLLAQLVKRMPSRGLVLAGGGLVVVKGLQVNSAAGATEFRVVRSAFVVGHIAGQ